MHVSYGHVNAKLLYKTAERLGVELTPSLRDCQRRSVAKGLKHPVVSRPTTEATRMLEHVSTNLMGTESVQTPDSKRSAILFRDDFRRHSSVYFVASESVPPRAWERLLADNRREGDIEIIRSNNGSEFAGSF